MPNPPDEKVNLSGWSFIRATSSAIDLAGTEGLTTRTWCEVMSLITGAKSTSSRKLMLGSRAGAAVVGKAMPRIVCPSAGCLRTSAAAIVPIAPGLFSTTIRQPSLCPSSLATMRVMMSDGVPAAPPTTADHVGRVGLCDRRLGDRSQAQRKQGEPQPRSLTRHLLCHFTLLVVRAARCCVLCTAREGLSFCRLVKLQKSDAFPSTGTFEFRATERWTPRRGTARMVELHA